MYNYLKQRIATNKGITVGDINDNFFNSHRVVVYLECSFAFDEFDTQAFLEPAKDDTFAATGRCEITASGRDRVQNQAEHAE